jgi:hypothetical protein
MRRKTPTSSTGEIVMIPVSLWSIVSYSVVSGSRVLTGSEDCASEEAQEVWTWRDSNPRWIKFAACLPHQATPISESSDNAKAKSGLFLFASTYCIL